MTSEFGLLLINLLLFFDATVVHSTSIQSAATISRNGKQMDLIDTSTVGETILGSVPTESQATATEPTTVSIKPAIITTAAANQNSPASEPEATTTMSSTNVESTTAQQPSQQPQQQQQQTQHIFNPWNFMWNSAQSFFPIIAPNRWSLVQSNQQQQQQSNSMPFSSNMQTTPVASITLTFGKATALNRLSETNQIKGSSNSMGILGCPPPIVLSNVCPEPIACDCSCDKKQPKQEPIVKSKQKNATSMPPPLSASTSASNQPSSGSATERKEPLHPNQQRQQQQQQQQPIKYNNILPFQSWQDFFLKPVQMISSRAALATTSVSSNSDPSTSSDGGDQNIVVEKQSSKLIPELSGFALWH